jgi:mRNA-degrading endonuclease toxin of MazEF toxin-antitoxin module
VTVGDLYWVELPTRGGRAQAGRRPGIILQSTSTLPTTLLVPLTSQLDALRFPGTILVDPTERTDCAALRSLLSFNSLRWTAGSSETGWATSQSKSLKKSFLRLTH